VNSNSIRLLPLRRGEVLRSGTLGATPIALAYEERTPHNPGIRFPSLLIDDILLVLNDAAGFAFVVYADDFIAEFEFSAGGGGREGLEESHEALAVEDAAGIELRHAGDWDGALGGVEVDYFLGCVLECCGKLGGKCEVG
jgi:hypothetical protein